MNYFDPSNWMNSTYNEINSLNKNRTCILVEKPKMLEYLVLDGYVKLKMLNFSNTKLG